MTLLPARSLLELALVLFLPLATMACSHSTTPPDNGGDSVSFNRISSFPAVHSGITEATRSVIRGQEEWDAFWDRFRTGSQPSSPPQVDFQEKMVVAWAMGTRSTGGYLAEVVQVREVPDGSLEVKVVEWSPGESCGTTQALTQPVDAVLVPRTDADVEFRTEAQVRQCDEGADDEGEPGY